jgi:hypothetical protein
MWFHAKVPPKVLSNGTADYFLLKFRQDVGDDVEVHLHEFSISQDDVGYWAKQGTGGYQPSFLKKDEVAWNSTEDVWGEKAYSFARASLVKADGEVTGEAGAVFTFALNVTTEDRTPMDWDGAVVDFWYGFYSSGGGLTLMGEVFGWSLGIVMIIMASASTPYWNPTRPGGKRTWRSRRVSVRGRYA